LRPCREFKLAIREFLPRSGNLSFVRQFKVIQGANYPSDQRIHFRAILEISRAQKCHFLPILAGKPLLSRCDVLAISHANRLRMGCFCRWSASWRSQFTVYKTATTTSSRLQIPPKFHIRQVLTRPERSPKFTVMRAAQSSTIERVTLDRFYLYLGPHALK
jgi:hypothetical protein